MPLLLLLDFLKALLGLNNAGRQNCHLPGACCELQQQLSRGLCLLRCTLVLVLACSCCVAVTLWAVEEHLGQIGRAAESFLLEQKAAGKAGRTYKQAATRPMEEFCLIWQLNLIVLCRLERELGFKQAVPMSTAWCELIMHESAPRLAFRSEGRQLAQSSLRRF